ncbi:MAG: hypothetical protein WBD98_20525 [Acidobacteriaceae bacterium]
MREAVSIRERRSRAAAPWTRLHDVSLGLVVGMLVFLALLLIATAVGGRREPRRSKSRTTGASFSPKRRNWRRSGLPAAAWVRLRS